jgi:hypothetical protein
VIRRIVVRSEPRQIVRETLSQKNLSQKKTGGVAQGIGPEFTLIPQIRRKRKRKGLKFFQQLIEQTEKQ